MSPSIPGSKYHLPWRGLPFELREPILKAALNIPLTGVIYHGSDEELKRLNYPRITQSINTSVLRLNHEAYTILTPFLYHRIVVHQYYGMFLIFLRYLSATQRASIKEVALPDYRIGSAYELPPLHFMTEILTLQRVELPIGDYLELGFCDVLLTAVWRGHLQYNPDVVQLTGPVESLYEIERLYIDYEHFIARTMGGTTMREIRRREVFLHLPMHVSSMDKAWSVHRSMYPFSIELHRSKPDISATSPFKTTWTVTIHANAEAARERIDKLMIAYSETGVDPQREMAADVENVPTFEERMSRLRRGLHIFEEARRSAR